MSNYYFIGNYENKNNSYKTLNFIERFSKQLEKRLIEKYGLLTIFLPRVDSFDKKNNPRLINFDNKINDCVYQIKENFDLYQLNLIDQFKLEHGFHGVISNYQKISRDVEVNSINSMVESILDLRIKITSLEKIEPETLIFNYTQEVYKIICDCFMEIKNELDINSDFIERKINVISLSNYLKRVRSLKVDDYIVQNLSNKKLSLITNINNLYSKHLIKADLLTEDVFTSSQLLYWYDDISEVVPLFSIALSANYKNAIKQLQIDNINVDLYQEELQLLKNSPEQIHIKINLSKLIMVLLNKIHIGEVVSGSWSKELLKEAKEKDIKIL